MKVTCFDLAFKHRERTFKATCQKFQVHNYPQIRVAVDRGKGNTDIYILYEVNRGRQKFFWFKLPDKSEYIVKAIASTLAKSETFKQP
jgi:hypothetical protein